MPAVSFQETIAADLPDHLFCVPIRQWCHAKTHIGQNLDVNSAKSEGDEWSKRGIFCNTNHDLHPVQHLLNQNSFHPFLLDFIERLPDGMFVIEIQSNCTDVGFMQDTEGGKFCSDWISDRTGDLDSLKARQGQATSGLRDFERGEHRAAFFR